MGSLVCALASYLDAKAHGGTWLVRMEDIDPPREQQGASTEILECLQRHHLHWDGDVLFQSTRAKAYSQTLNTLREHQLAYPCNCTRKRLAPLNGRYDGHCKHHTPAPPAALRLHLTRAAELGLSLEQHFEDGLQGPQQENLDHNGDFVIHRKDGLFAYQLAVVVDDIAQGISHIVRGSDLLDTTARQCALFEVLGKAPPNYSHIPVLNDANGNKLSKQNHAPAIDNGNVVDNLIRALQFLGFPCPTANDPETLLTWAQSHWLTVRESLKGKRHI